MILRDPISDATCTSRLRTALMINTLVVLVGLFVQSLLLVLYYRQGTKSIELVLEYGVLTTGSAVLVLEYGCDYR
jgi:hypothetical protein